MARRLVTVEESAAGLEAVSCEALDTAGPQSPTGPPQPTTANPSSRPCQAPIPVGRLLGLGGSDPLTGRPRALAVQRRARVGPQGAHRPVGPRSRPCSGTSTPGACTPRRSPTRLAASRTRSSSTPLTTPDTRTPPSAMSPGHEHQGRNRAPGRAHETAPTRPDPARRDRLPSQQPTPPVINTPA